MIITIVIHTSPTEGFLKEYTFILAWYSVIRHVHCIDDFLKSKFKVKLKDT